MARVVTYPDMTRQELDEARKDPENCRQCNGTGKIVDDSEGTSWLDVWDEQHAHQWLECPVCGGDGEAHGYT